MSHARAKNQVVYAFIDSQNLNLGIRSQNWALDYKKFRLYLRNKYNVAKAYMFIGLVTDNQALYTELQEAGFILVFKPTVRYFENDQETVKGNVDAELVLQAAAIEYNNYDKAIIVSGDGDFHCLVRFLAERNKLLHLMVPNRHFSKLLRDFSSYVIVLGSLRRSLSYNKKSRDRRSVETLGLPGHGDAQIIPKKHPRINSQNNQPKDSHSQGQQGVIKA